MITDTSPYNNKSNTSPQMLLQLVDDLKYAIHFIAVFLRILQWKEPHEASSFTLLCALFLHSTLNGFFIFLALALLLVLKTCHCYYAPETKNQTRRHLASSHDLLIADLSEIRDKVQWITATANWLLQQSDTIYCAYFLKYVSINSSWWSSKIYFAVSCLDALFYAGWLRLLQEIDLTCTFCCSLQLILCLYCPWTYQIITAFIRATSIIMLYVFPSNTAVTAATSAATSVATSADTTARNTAGATASTTTGNTSATTATITVATTTKNMKAPSTDEDTQGQRYSSIHRFEIHEHQRWWHFSGWRHKLILGERTAWTDKDLKEMPHIYDFKLPPTFDIGEPNEHNQQKVGTWRWINARWSCFYETGGSGWQYGNWNWNNWGRAPYESGVYTRRRKWYRDARLIESWIDAPKTELCAGEYALVNYIPSGDCNQSSISDESARNRSTSYITSKLSTFSSLSRKGKGLLRHHSGNLFNEGVTFMNMTTAKLYSTSANDAYKPSKLKKF